jgi:hypothetical protein
MSDIADYIATHKQGGFEILDIYHELEQGLSRYNTITGQMRSLKGTGDWALPHVSGGQVVAVELIDGDEPFIGSMGNAMMDQVYSVKRMITALMNKGWGNLPVVQKNYEQIMQEPFPKEYIGIEIPAQYQTIDAKLIDSIKFLEK